MVGRSELFKNSSLRVSGTKGRRVERRELAHSISGQRKEREGKLGQLSMASKEKRRKSARRKQGDWRSYAGEAASKTQ